MPGHGTCNCSRPVATVYALTSASRRRFGSLIDSFQDWRFLPGVDLQRAVIPALEYAKASGPGRER
jgi:hypothetical protein